MAGPLRAGRAATFASFALNGFLMGMWIVHIPEIEHRTGIDHAVLGRLLLLLGAGAVAGMRIAGPLTDRAGARTVVPLGAALCSAALVLPGTAANAWTLGAALTVLGIGNGVLDVAMNAHAVQVERGYGRPVMSAFHAAYSIGGVLAALAAARTLTWDWPPAAALGAAAALGIAAAAAIRPALLRSGPAPDTAVPDTVPDAAPGTAVRTERRRTPRRIWRLALLALMIMLCEGVANDWSVLHLRTVLDAPAGTAAIAYGAFSVAMTTGRLLADRVTARYGPVAVLRHGAALAAIGLAAGALSPWVALAITGWAVFGAGLSGCVPQLFSAAGHHDRAAAGANVSRVAGLGYLGMLAGPGVIGPLTHVMPLNLTFFLPVAFCVAASAAAGILRPRADVGAVPAPGRESDVSA
ncbi:MFS transporter [Actinomadura darangshiensis]|uniref:MFS transporter n=1 Tax=Actinomadura darangshiensis TaxID=705336 RepID=A0A4R5AQR7_9ACTN|nr:MFS transporter [Actinomadura darangshiensis]TDD73394.1 MFS transporter [Actinomadura darangshiensis]